MFPLKDNIPTDRFPVVTVVLIVLNVIVYFFLQDGGWSLTSNTTGDWPVDEYALVPCDISGECAAPAGHVGDVASLFTSMFMHGSLLHLGGNMLFLWIFGNNVEDSMGPVKFILFYLAGGVAADALQIVFDTGSAVPTLGASGAVAAVLGGYILLYPRARVVTVIFVIVFFTILELPALARARPVVRPADPVQPARVRHGRGGGRRGVLRAHRRVPLRLRSSSGCSRRTSRTSTPAPDPSWPPDGSRHPRRRAWPSSCCSRP